MPRRSTRIRWEQTDGHYRVAVFARNDRAAFLVESGFRGHQPRAQSALDEPEAVSIAQAIWTAYQSGAIEAPVIAPETLDELIDLLAEQPEHSPKTRKGYRQTWTQFAGFVGKRHPKKLYPLDVRGFLAQYAGATRDRYLRELRAGFNWAIAQGFVNENPCLGLKEEHKHEMGPWLPHTEWDNYLHYCTPAHRIRSEFVPETGLRAGEIAAARWDWIHGQVGMRALHIAADERSHFVPKWGMARAVPLSKSALAVLEDAKKRWPDDRGGAGFIFSADGLSALGNLAAETAEAVARASCTPTDFHGLRRSAGAMWLEHGASLFEVSRLLGHQDLKTTAKWYAGVSDRHLGEIIDRVQSAREANAAVPSLSAQTRKRPK